jgi:predicted PurR-regulated permease PerM
VACAGGGRAAWCPRRRARSPPLEPTRSRSPGPLDATLPPRGAAVSAQRRGNAGLLLILIGAATIALLVWPVFPGLTLAAVLSTVFTPVHKRLATRVRPPWLAATLSTLLAALLVLVPLSGVAFIVGTEAVSAVEWLSDRPDTTATPMTDALRGVLARTAGRFGIDPAMVVAEVEGQARRVLEIVASRTLGFLSGIPGVLLQAGVALFALFYLLRDGDQFMAALRRMAPLDPELTEELLSRARDITYATVFGNVLVAIVQGLIGGVAFQVLGLPAAALWGTIMAVMAMIPMVGPPIIWIPAAIYLAVTGGLVRAIVLALVGILIIGTVDNFIRAVFVGGRARVHSLIVFLSVLGGVLVFGAAGIVVGPVLFVMALIAIEAGRLALKGGEQLSRPSPPSGERARPRRG